MLALDYFSKCEESWEVHCNHHNHQKSRNILLISMPCIAKQTNKLQETQTEKSHNKNNATKTMKAIGTSHV